MGLSVGLNLKMTLLDLTFDIEDFVSDRFSTALKTGLFVSF